MGKPSGVTVAKSAGFCPGVKRAVQLVYDAASDENKTVYTLGPIIHNETVVADLEKKGVKILEEEDLKGGGEHLPEKGSTVVIRSHGISKAVLEELEKKGYEVTDATCPFVAKIHRIAEEAGREGKILVIVGDPDHPEVKGIRGWTEGESYCVMTKDDAAKLSVSEEKELIVVAQTTFHYHKFQEIVEIIQSLGYHISVKNTICNATWQRQTEAMDLAGKSDVMLVIGGSHSSNTRKLYDICLDQCENTYYLRTIDDLATVNIPSGSYVGITAGASTPNQIIQEVSLHVSRAEL